MADDSKIDYITRRLDGVAEKVSDISVKVGAQEVKLEVQVADLRDINSELKRNNDILQTNTASLQEHIRRTNLLESYVKHVEERFSPIELEQVRKKAINEWIKKQAIFLAKISGMLGAVGGAGAAIKYVSHLLGF